MPPSWGEYATSPPAASLPVRRCTVTAVSDALYHHASRRPLADGLTCIREKQRLDTAGALLSRNAERQILDPAEMARRWRHAPQALANAAELAGMCRFAMDDLSYEYPDEVSPGGRDAIGELEYQTWNCLLYTSPSPRD